MRKTAIVLSAAAVAAMLFTAGWTVSADTAPAAPTTLTTTTPPPAKPKAKPGRINGPVTAVDTTTKTVTVTIKDVPTTFTLDPAAEIFVSTKGTLANIGATDRIRVDAAADIADGSTTVTATRISVLPAAKPNAKAGTGYEKKHVEGDVVTLSPLTIKTPGGVTVAVTTTDITPVYYNTPGQLSDIVVGARVTAEGKDPGTGLVAKRVVVTPAGDVHGKGMKKKAA